MSNTEELKKHFEGNVRKKPNIVRVLNIPIKVDDSIALKDRVKKALKIVNKKYNPKYEISDYWGYAGHNVYTIHLWEVVRVWEETTGFFARKTVQRKDREQIMRLSPVDGGLVRQLVPTKNLEECLNILNEFSQHVYGQQGVKSVTQMFVED